MNFLYILYLDMRIIELTIWHREHLVIMYDARIFILKQN
jgi:hypothetical protein